MWGVKGGRSSRMILAGKTHFPPFAPHKGHVPLKLEYNPANQPALTPLGRLL